MTWRSNCRAASSRVIELPTDDVAELMPAGRPNSRRRSKRTRPQEWEYTHHKRSARAHVSSGASAINPRLVNLLGSFIGGTSAYTLARLEFCLNYPNDEAPPVLGRLPDASELTLREHWESIEEQLYGVLDFVKHIDSDPRRTQRTATSFRSLKRTVRELDQYARAMRWVMTVTEGDAAE